MKSTRPTKNAVVDIAFVILIVVFFYFYFVVYMTPSRSAWYREMRNQMKIFIQEVKRIGH